MPAKPKLIFHMAPVRYGERYRLASITIHEVDDNDRAVIKSPMSTILDMIGLALWNEKAWHAWFAQFAQSRVPFTVHWVRREQNDGGRLWLPEIARCW